MAQLLTRAKGKHTPEKPIKNRRRTPRNVQRNHVLCRFRCQLPLVSTITQASCLNKQPELEKMDCKTEDKNLGHGQSSELRALAPSPDAWTHAQSRKLKGWWGGLNASLKRQSGNHHRKRNGNPGSKNAYCNAFIADGLRPARNVRFLAQRCTASQSGTPLSEASKSG